MRASLSTSRCFRDQFLRRTPAFCISIVAKQSSCSNRPWLQQHTPRATISYRPFRTSYALSRRNFSSTQRNPMVEPKFSGPVEPAELTKSVEALKAPRNAWAVSSDGLGLERTFKFKTFKSAWAFMTAIAEQCKNNKHHPEWSNVYNTVFIRWTTHAPRGLSEKDVRMAELCSQLADEHGVLQSEIEDEVLKQTAVRVVQDGGDCCDPQQSRAGNEGERQREKKKIEAEEGATGEEGGLKGIGGQPS